jgi:ligand-binding sensor domain-containing protein/signal transduction histidine kinase
MVKSLRFLLIATALLSGAMATRCWALGAAEVPQYSVRQWQTDDGLPFNTVSFLLQARDNYLWIGTARGLARFDGVHFTSFTHANTPELDSGLIRALYQSQDGTVWIDAGNGLSSFKDGKFRLVSLHKETSPETSRVLVQAPSRDGSSWLATGLGVVKDQDGRRTLVKKAGKGVIQALCEDAEGRLWIGTDVGLVHSQDRSMTSWVDQPGFRTNGVLALCMDHETNLWIGTAGSGLARLSGGQCQYFGKASGLPDERIGALFEDRRGALWVGTSSGLYLRMGERFAAVSQNDGISYEWIACMMEDSEGNLWVGTREGLSRLRLKTFSAYTRTEGLSHNNCICVCADTQGTVWATTWGGGVNRIKDATITHFNRQNGGPYDLLLSVTQTRDGSLWMGGDYDGGLYQFKDGSFTRYGKSRGLVDTAVRALCQDRHDDLWIGTSGALYQMHEGKFRRFTTKDGLPNNIIRSLYEDREGNLWVGTGKGMARWRDGHFTTYRVKDGLSDESILCFYEDKEGSLWIGTGYGGLNRLHNGKFTTYSKAQGLFHDCVSTIQEDDRGNFWMSCFLGVFRVNKKQFDEFDRGVLPRLHCASYDKADGMSTVQCNGVAQPASAKAPDGRIWFPTVRGAVVVDPSAIPEKQEPPPVVIEEMLADTHSCYRAIGPQPGESTGGLRIPAGRGELAFRFTALSLSAPEKNRFKYQLEGVDRDWVDAGTTRTVTYNNILPGNYRFRVIACNNEGVWNEAGTSLGFYLAPHFYQTSLFYYSMAAAAVLAVLGIFRWRFRQMRANQLELQRLVNERTKDLQAAQERLVEASRKAGMAEVASNILHNVGNVLNSVNVSAGIAVNRIQNSKRSSLEKVVALIQQHAADLGSFFTTHEKGRLLPDYLHKLARQWSQDESLVIEELKSLSRNIDHIKDIVSMQQTYARVSGLVETVNLAELVEDAVRINGSSLERQEVCLLKEYSDVGPVATEKHKVLQILVNLIRNAKDACEEERPQSKQIQLRISNGGEFAKIQVIDNGIGIPPENLTKIFAHGFTTRKDGHGFGLHGSALAAKELKGSLTVHSDGPHRGATFTLTLPRHREPAH